MSKQIFMTKDINILKAHQTISKIIRKTPLEHSPYLSDICQADVYLKLENIQKTGSFKLRGAANKILSLTEQERQKGVITCSSGNHGKAVAYAAKITDTKAVICLPQWVPKTKIEAMKLYGAEVVVFGKNYDEAEEKSLQIQQNRSLIYVHAFDDPYVIAGQGTIGLEILEDLSSFDIAVVPLSGGGLISGIALALKEKMPNIKVVGVSQDRSPVMYHSIKAGKPIDLEELSTIANALSGGIGAEQNKYTFRLVEELVDEYVLVTEAEIIEAINWMLAKHQQVVEGGGAVGIAALLSKKINCQNKKVVNIVSGKNIDFDVLKDIINT